MNRVNITEKDYGVFINNPDHFLAVSDFADSDGINIVENVNIIKSQNSSKSASKPLLNQETRKYIAHETDSINFFRKSYGDLILYTFISNDLILQDFTENLQVLNSANGFENAKLDISHVVYIKKALSKKDLIEIFKIVSKIKAKYLANLNLPRHITNILDNNEFLAILCDVPKDDELNFDNIDIEELDIEESINKSMDESFKRFDLTFGILDYLVSEGILIGDLIDAGMELVDDADVNDELRQKMEDQIFKALSDVNVIMLLMAAFRTEQDVSGRRIREINATEYNIIYSDELLGLAISNQIAGTKAVFNFNRYITVKPGVLAYLPPMVDNVFAGLIAGCVSKIFDD